MASEPSNLPVFTCDKCHQATRGTWPHGDDPCPLAVAEHEAYVAKVNADADSARAATKANAEAERAWKAQREYYERTQISSQLQAADVGAITKAFQQFMGEMSDPDE